MIPFMSGAKINLTYTSLTAKVNATTIVVPVTAVVGDIAFLFQSSQDSVSAPAAVNPAGWALVQSNTGLLVRMMCSVKLLVAGDLGATLTGMNANVNNNKMILVFRPSRITSLPQVGFDTNQQITANAPASQSLPAASYTAPILCLSHMCSGNSDGAITGDSMTPAADGSEANGTHHKVSYKIFNTAPANITVAMGDAGAINGLQSTDSIFS